MKQIGISSLLALVLFAGLPALAENAPGSDPVAAALIPPEVVMAHQDALGLTDAQRKAIQADVQNAQQRFTGLQWKLSGATEKLVTVLEASHIDQDRALDAMDAVLAAEREVKHTQLTLMVQIKNELTPDQQARAHAFVAGSAK